MAPPASVEELWTVAQLGSMPPLEQRQTFALREVVQTLDVHVPNSRKGKAFYQGIADRVQICTGDRTVQRPDAMQFEGGSWHAFTVWGRFCLTMLRPCTPAGQGCRSRFMHPHLILFNIIISHTGYDPAA